VREFRWLELSALKWADLFIPLPNHPLLGGIGRAYYGTDTTPGMTMIPGEIPPSCYIGILGIAAFVWLTVEALRQLGKNQPIPKSAWAVLWTLLYSAVGGINCLAGILFGLTLFRSSTRYCIFIMALLLLWAGKRLSTIALDREMRIFVILFAGVLVLWDQTPPLGDATREMKRLEVIIKSDRMFAQALEARLPKGAMVFQIPIMDFPEAPSTLPAYDHFRPYLHTDHLRFSFGGMKGRPSAEWQKAVGNQPLPRFIRDLERYGFAALYINRRGFPPDRIDKILEELRQLGYKEMLQSPMGDLVAVILNPSAQPELPAGKIN